MNQFIIPAIVHLRKNIYSWQTCSTEKKFPATCFTQHFSGEFIIGNTPVTIFEFELLVFPGAILMYSVQSCSMTVDCPGKFVSEFSEFFTSP